MASEPPHAAVASAPGVDHQSPPSATWKNEVMFYLNGKRVVLSDINPSTTLLEFLRSPYQHLTGAKSVCAEGGCGACTVMVSRFDPTALVVRHSAVNACLFPLCAVDGAAIITVEGIGNVDHLHPVQEQIAKLHGSQCGFCTPGIVMALYAFLRMHPHATAKEIEDSLDGNLCRCTGYRPIISAAQSFASDAPNGAARRVCPSSGKPCDCGDSGQVFNLDPNTANKSQFPSDLIFPPELRKYTPKPIHLTHVAQDGTKTSWFRPTTLHQALRLKRNVPSIRPIVGSSEISIERHFKNLVPKEYLYLGDVPDLNTIEVRPDALRIGAAAPLSRVLEMLNLLITERPEHQTRSFVALREQLRWFGSNQIRNVACIGGNLATASPISDLMPTLWAIGAKVWIQEADSLPQAVPFDSSFLLGYRKTRLRPHELIVSIDVPFSRENEFIMSYMQSRRKEDDIAIASAAFRVVLERSAAAGGEWVVAAAHSVHGGMAAVTKSAVKTEQFLLGRQWNETTLNGALNCLKEDLPLASDAPGGMVDYRRAISLSFFYKFYLLVASKIHPNLVDPSELGELDRHDAMSGEQSFPAFPEKAPVGEPVPVISALKHATGEAIFVDDIPVAANELHGAYVYSARPHAELVSIDASDALKRPGVVAFLSAADIPGLNTASLPHLTDEPLFATGTVNAVGQIIGLVVAESHNAARWAARAVRVEYRDLPAVISFEEAIRTKNFEKPLDGYSYRFGDVDAVWSQCEHMVEGQVSNGAQNHFFLEPHSCVAWPGEEKEVTVVSSTQSVNNVQTLISTVLKVPKNRIEVKVKRVGGGFGGKETRASVPAAAAALAAKKLKRPVRIVMDRDDNMLCFGGRHAFTSKYKVGFNNEGKIIALDMQLYIDSGWHLELSPEVLGIAMWSSSSAYQIENFRVTGFVCKTNKASGCAFRAFGRPQSVVVIETVLDHISHVVKRNPVEVRGLNLMPKGGITVTKSICDVDVPRLWHSVLEKARFAARRLECDEFNKKNKWLKRGISCVPLMFGIGLNPKSLMQAGAIVNVFTDGSVLLHHSGAELGNGISTKLVQIAAKTLGVPFEAVHTVDTSTSSVPNATATCGSITTDLAGPAVQNCCEELRKRLEPVRERLGPNATFAQVAAAAYEARIDLSAHGFARPYDCWWDWKKGEGQLYEYFTGGAACISVEIDTLTGAHTVLNTEMILDVGESINPAIDIGQIEGGFMMGYGFYTMEEMVYDPATGIPLTRGPGLYKIPGFGDVPQAFNVTLLKDGSNPRAIFSSRAIGEPAVVLAIGVPLAIRDAIRAARAERQGEPDWFVVDVPFTCERIRMACEDQFTSLISS